MENYLYADLYNTEEKHWWHISKRKLIRRLTAKYTRGKLNILDVGCGTGKNMEELRSFGEVWGLDSSDVAIEFCRSQRGLKNVYKGDAEKTPFLGEKFDLITMLDVLEHTNDQKTLKESGRILKKGGLLIITVPAYQWMWSKWDEVLHHKRRYTKSKLVELLEKNNFEVVKASYLYSFLLPPVYIIRKIKSLISPNSYGSDFNVNLPIINSLFLTISHIENSAVMSVGIPFGLSIVAVVKKK